jgi:hypothetical protein
MKTFFKKHLHKILIWLRIIVILLIGLFAFLRIKGFIKPIIIDREISDWDLENYKDNNDFIFPLMDDNGYVIKREHKNILIFGNGPFAEDRDSKDGMANMLEEELGVNVINCAVSDSYGAMRNSTDLTEYPMDIYSPYYLVDYMAFSDKLQDAVDEAVLALDTENPKDGKEVLETLANIDMSEVDTVVFMYDLTDYYMDIPVSLENLETAQNTFGGGILKAVNDIATLYPETRVIVMSPYYNGMTDEKGNEISAELVKNSYGVPSDYAISLGGDLQVYSKASYIDNYFGTINEANYKKYLKDNTHLNQEGRKLIVERLVDAITRFD